jgi:hypothetical protein
LAVWKEPAEFLDLPCGRNMLSLNKESISLMAQRNLQNVRAFWSEIESRKAGSFYIPTGKHDI